MLARLTRTCYRRRRLTVLAWVIAAVGLAALGSALVDEFRMDDSLPGSETQAAGDLLADAGFGGRSGYTGQIVFAAPEVESAAVRADADRLLDRVRAELPEVEIISPYSDAGAAQVSPDGTVAFAELDLGDIELDDALRLADEVHDIRAGFEADSGVQIELGGELFFEESEFSSEGFGLAAAIIILLVAFGSVLAMGLPIVTALFGIATGTALVNLATNVLDIPDFVPSIVIMIAIGVGIDYALFIVTRYREELAGGAGPEDAVVIALDTAGRAVLFAGATVVISMLGLLVIGLAVIQSVAFAAAAGVLTVMVATITLLPALLGFAGRNIDRLGLPHRRRGVAGDGPGLWYRWSRVVQRRPGPVAALGLIVLVALALPAAAMRLGFSDAGNRPETDTSRRAYDLVEHGFGVGYNGPLFLAAELRGDDADDAAVLQRLRAALDRDAGVATVVPPITDDAGSVALVQVFPTTSPQDADTADLVRRIRDDIEPAVTGGGDARILVGGSVAGAVDFAELQFDRLPLFIGAVLLLSFLLLMVTFRSLLVPLKAVVMNLLSIGAAYGVVVAVSQWGWGSDLVGIETGPIDAWAPMMLFAIVFGLSMDYEVFLLSRIKEEYEHSGDNAAAVATGLARTARLITAAAAIMVCVFGGFVLSLERSLQLFGLGLAVAVLLDATIVRLVLVPATMELLGDRNWWLPRAIGRLMPVVRIEGGGVHSDTVPLTTGRR